MAIATCLNTLAIMNMYSSRYEEALDHFQHAHDLMEKLKGTTHPELIQIRTNIGVLYGELGLFWRSLEYHRQNLPYLESLSPSPHLNGLLNMASTLIAVGEYEEAWEYLDQGEAFLQQHPGMTPENVAYVKLQRSIILKEQDQAGQALILAEEALVKNKEIFGTNHPALFEDFLHKGILQLELGQEEEALRSFRKLLQLAMTTWPPTLCEEVMHFIIWARPVLRKSCGRSIGIPESSTASLSRQWQSLRPCQSLCGKSYCMERIGQLGLHFANAPKCLGDHDPRSAFPGTTG